MLLVAAATLIGAALQSATGFGFALILSPAMLALLDPHEAVTALLVLGFALNLLLLFGDGGEPAAVRWRAVGPMLLAALPGLGAGLLLLAAMSKPALQLTVGVAVMAAALAQARRAPAPAAREPTLRSACAVGLASGALTTSTTISGPPIVLWLQSHGVTPAELRASLAASFLFLSVAGVALLAVDGALAAEPAVVLPLLLVTALGQLLGARVFRRVDPSRFRSVVLALALLAGAASLVAGISGVSA